MSAALAPDRIEIARALSILQPPDSVIELRALVQRGRKRTIAGYFDAAHRAELLEQAAKLNAGGAAVYVVMNPLDPQLLGRYANRVEDYAQATATDLNVTRRRWLLVDIDPVRPKDTSATQEQLEAAMGRAGQVCAAMRASGWPMPVAAESGNGAHLLYRIDLQNDEPSRDLVKGCLAALAVKFDDATVKVDRAVFNAARIVKLHGTIANKGDNLPSAPWRLSRLRSVPEPIETVSLEQLQALAIEAAPIAIAKPNGHDRTARSGHAWTEAAVSAFLGRGGIEVLGEPAPHDGSTRWRLKRCPFNPEHGPTESAVFLAADGRLGFKCQHNSCADRHWADLRELVDGPHESRRAERAPHAQMSATTEQYERTEKEWAEPVNLFAELTAPPFSSNELPAELGTYPELYAEQTGIDPTIMLIAAAGAAAAAIPDQIQLCASSSSHWFAQARLWFLTIASPGAGKSPGQREMLAPLWKLHTELDSRWRDAVRGLPDDDPKPPRPRVVLGDVTLEALSDVLAENPRGVLLATDEFDAWLGAMDQYRNGGLGRDRGEWLRLFDGGPHSIERVKRGTVFVPNWGASILTATTPAAMGRLTRHLPEDGLLQRFIVTVAKRQKVMTDVPERAQIEAERSRYAETLNRLWRIEPRAHNGIVSLSCAATERFHAWRSENLLLQEALGSLDPALEGHIAKYPTLALRLALTFHCAHTVNLADPLARDPAAYPIPLETLETALAFLKRASQHALVVYLGRKGGSDAYELAKDIARFVLARSREDNHDGLQRRDIVQRVGSFRAADEDVQTSALHLLTDLGWLREGQSAYQKAQPTRFAVNPGLHSRFEEISARERKRRAIARAQIAESAEGRKADRGTA